MSEITVTTTLTQAAIDVLAERRRQIERKGYDRSHDDNEILGQLAKAAAIYAEGSSAQAIGVPPEAALYMRAWPWSNASLKWESQRENLVKAGALILAEIERLDRMTE